MIKKYAATFLASFTLLYAGDTLSDYQPGIDFNPQESGFYALQENKTLTEGQSEVRHAPFSTFKLFLLTVGLQEGILTDAQTPKWTFKPEMENRFPEICKGITEKYGWTGEHTPKTFMQKSVVWFSHEITERLTQEGLQHYLSALHYGNEDASGGIYESWLDSSIQISPREQVAFIQNTLFNPNNVIHPQTQHMARTIAETGDIVNGWKICGKTGGGNLGAGWFVGWLEKADKRIFFAHYITLTPKGQEKSRAQNLSTGKVAKAVALDYLNKNGWLS